MRSIARLHLPLAFLICGLFTAGCATTRIVETWSAPGLGPEDLAFEHVVAIAIFPEEARQRIAEDALASRATTTKVTPAYALLESADRSDVERLRGVLESHGIDGAITLRLVDVEEQQTYVPGTTRMYPMGYYGYYGAVGIPVYEPGYVRKDTYAVVETSLYDVDQGKLLWSGVSRTLNPRSIDDLIGEIATAARAELHAEGLLP